MMGRRPSIRVGLLLYAMAASGLARSEAPDDLYFGEALYFAHQELYFDALARLDSEVRQHQDVDEPELDSLYRYIDNAEFSLGDFELRYRMHHRAGRAITAVLEGAVDDLIRNDAAFRLAKIHFQKGQLDEAEMALDRIDGRIPDAIADGIDFLAASVALAKEDFESATRIFANLLDSDEFGSYAAYNLGISYLQSGLVESAQKQLERAGRWPARDAAELAVRDKANLVLGTILLERGEFSSAADAFDRVRIEGRYSNEALLSSGWSSISAGDFSRAVVPWSELSRRSATDASTQEAMLALPYAYGNLDLHGKAAIHYGQALDAFQIEVERLNQSISSIRDGRFLEALVREEIRHNSDWVVRLRILPDAPETFYLTELLATHEFQTGLQNYLDLSDLKRKLLSWQRNFDAFDDMVAIRSAHYEPLLPEVDTEFRQVDSRFRLRREQHRILTKRRDELLTSPHPEYLATPSERNDLAGLDELESALKIADPGAVPVMSERIRRLRGVLLFTIETEYHERLTEFHRNLNQLDEVMAVADARYESFVRSRQAATHSFTGYTKPVLQLRIRVQAAISKIDQLLARQGHELETVAVNELIARRGRLEGYRDKARFALADSYDRATQTQASRSEP